MLRDYIKKEDALNSKQPFNKVLTLPITSLPKVTFHEWDTIASQLTTYFSKLLEKYQVSNKTVSYLKLPSIINLSGYLNCCEMDIFDALYEMKHHGYIYELHGIDAPILLHDPLYREHGERKQSPGLQWWHTVSDLLASPKAGFPMGYVPLSFAK